MSTDTGGAGGPVVAVYAPTAAELSAVKAGLERAGPLLAHKPGIGQQGGVQQRCNLTYALESSSGSCGTAMQAPASSSFSTDRYYARLGSSSLGRILLTAASLRSTQEMVQENVTRLPDGVVLVADKQAGGKGRGGNRWESPDGCLMFSALSRLDIPGARLPFVQYLVSLAVVQAAKEEASRALAICASSSSSSNSSNDITGRAESADRSSSSHGKAGSADPSGSSRGTAGAGSPSGRILPEIEVRIKWPNDIYSGNHKLGGVLCHSSYRDKLFCVTMGVGLNVSNRQPTTCLDALVEAAARQAGLQQHPPEPLSREVLLANICSRLERMLGQLCWEGFAPFEPDYYAAWLHSGQAVTLQEDGQQVAVRVQGLSQHGYLLASDESGQSYELHPDGNSLDFFQGLIRKKVSAC